MRDVTTALTSHSAAVIKPEMANACLHDLVASSEVVGVEVVHAGGILSQAVNA